MKAAVIYESKRGSTAKYAGWIAEELGCASVPVDSIIKDGKVMCDEAGELLYLDEFDVIVFGGWLRGSGIVGLDKFKKALASAGTGLEAIADKLVIFVTGISVYNPANHMQICEINFPEAAKGKMDMSKIKLYFCPGAYDVNSVKGLDKMMMRVARSVLKGGRTKEGLDDANMMIGRIENGIDLVDRKFITPIVKAAKKIAGSETE